MKKNKSIIILALLVFCNTIYGQTISSNEIDSIVQHVLSDMKHTGIALGVVYNGEIIYAQGHGVTSVNTKKAVSEKTLFPIGSISKPFTAMTVAILVEEGQLNWDDKVIKHLPDFKMYDPYITENLTIKDILCHRSGLKNFHGDLMVFPSGTNFTKEELLSSFQFLKPTYGFREKFGYSNRLYFVVGEIIAKVSGRSYEEYVSSRIFKPLNMNASVAGFNNVSNVNNYASPHILFNNKITELDHTNDPNRQRSPAGGICSNVDDMTKWISMILNLYKTKNSVNDMISYDRIEEMWQPYTHLNPNIRPSPRSRSHFRGFGLGWIVRDLEGYWVVEHNGGIPGIFTSVKMIPELNFGIILLSNSSYTQTLNAIENSIIDEFLDIEGIDWVEFLSKQEDSHQKNKYSITKYVWDNASTEYPANIKPTDYTGTFEDPWFGKVEIVFDENKLVFKAERSPLLTGELLYFKENSFVLKCTNRLVEADALVTFQFGQDRPTGIRMSRINRYFDASLDYRDLNLRYTGESSSREL